MSKYQALYAEKANIGFEAGICTQDLKWQVIQPNIFFFSWNSSSQQSGIIKSIHRCRHLAESSQWRLHCEPKFPKTAPAPFLLPCKAQNILSYKCLSLLLIFFQISEVNFHLTGSRTYTHMWKRNSSWRAAAQQQPLRRSLITESQALRSSLITLGCKQHQPVLPQQDSLSAEGQHKVCTRRPSQLSVVLNELRSLAL